jgi:membrane-associated protein
LFDQLWELFHRIYDVEGIIRWGGVMAITVIVFSETGLMIGFFLPGDSLLVTAGLLASGDNPILELKWLLILGCIAAVAGDFTGYWIGYKVGAPLYRRKQTWWFRRDHLLKTKAFYEKHGGKTIVIARFIPIVRTFAPVVAGIARMKYLRFLSFNVWGGIGWVVGMCLLGYFLGWVPIIRKRIDVVIVVVIFVSLLPAIIPWLKSRLSRPPKR